MRRLNAGRVQTRQARREDRHYHGLEVCVKEQRGQGPRRQMPGFEGGEMVPLAQLPPPLLHRVFCHTTSEPFPCPSFHPILLLPPLLCAGTVCSSPAHRRQRHGRIQCRPAARAARAWRRQQLLLRRRQLQLPGQVGVCVGLQVAWSSAPFAFWLILEPLPTKAVSLQRGPARRMQHIYVHLLIQFFALMTH